MAASPASSIRPAGPGQSLARAMLVPTGNTVLDDGLGGGLPSGSLFQVDGEPGSGSVEFALSVLKGASASGHSIATFASVLRSPGRVLREADALFPDGHRIAPVALPLPLDPARCLVLANELGPGDVLAFESLAGLSQAAGGDALVPLVRDLAEAAERSQGIILVLHTTGSLPPEVEARLSEVVDGNFCFLWRDGGTTRRRFLRVGRLRGLAPMIEQEEVPIFEVGLRKGAGFTISRVKNVI